MGTLTQESRASLAEVRRSVGFSSGLPQSGGGPEPVLWLFPRFQNA